MTGRLAPSVWAAMVTMIVAALAVTATAKVPPQVPLPSSCDPLVCACAEDLAAANCTGKVSITYLLSISIYIITSQNTLKMV